VGGVKDGKKKNLSLKFYKKKIFYLSTLLNFNKEKLAVNIDLISILLYLKTIFKLQFESIRMINYHFVRYLGHRNIALSLPYRPSLRFYAKVSALFFEHINI
jgi:hypothetical protein